MVTHYHTQTRQNVRETWQNIATTSHGLIDTHTVTTQAGMFTEHIISSNQANSNVWLMGGWKEGGNMELTSACVAVWQSQLQRGQPKREGGGRCV